MPKVTTEQLERAVQESYSYANVLRLLGFRQAGGTQANIKHRIIQEGIDISHFTGRSHGKGKRPVNKKTAKDILVLGSRTDRRAKSSELRRGLDEIGRKRECEKCGLGEEWEGSLLILEIDHINGERWDHREHNLRYLCPNCHSQT